MGIFKEIPPTAGWPIYIKDLLATLFKQSCRGGYSLEDKFKDYLQVEYSRLTTSGTVAFYIILEALKELSSKRTVIIPAYICPLVPLAIKRAGLNVEVCDIDKEGFDFDKTELEKICFGNTDILAIVPAHLAGIPVDLDGIVAIAKKYGIFVVEDCAQALGAVYKNKPVGTLGDFSFFSLCRGKGLTIYEGGIIVTNKKEYAKLLDEKIKELVKDNFFAETLKILELFGYWIFYRPQLFWFVFKLPQAFWNMLCQPLKAVQDDYDINFPIHRVSGFRKAVGGASFYHLEEAGKNQRRIANYYIDKLKGIQGIKVIRETGVSTATYPYLTLVFDEPQKREAAFRLLNNSGLGVSQIYALAITDYPYLKGTVPERKRGDCPNARYLAERELTLSTSQFLKEKDLFHIVNFLNLNLDLDL